MSLGPRLLFLLLSSGPRLHATNGLFVSLTGPVRALSRSQLSSALAVLFLPLWHAQLGSMRNLRHPRPPWRLTYLGSQGSWSCADWEFGCQVRTLPAFLDSDSGAASRRSGGDTVET